MVTCSLIVNDFETLNLFWQPFSKFESSGKIGTGVCVYSEEGWIGGCCSFNLSYLAQPKILLFAKR